MTAPTQTIQNDVPAVSLTRRWAVYFSVAAVGLGMDLWTKHAVFGSMGLPGESEPYWLIEGVFGIQTAVNIGALFGIGQGQGLFFAAFSVIATLGILVWLAKFGAIQSRYLTIVLGMVTGGILGNLYDRLGLWNPRWVDNPVFDPAWKSGVRDWILFRIEGVKFFDPWPNFNIADSLLVVGAAMLVIHSFFLATPQASEDDENTDAGTESEPNPQSSPS